MIYLGTFAFSVICIYFASNEEGKRNRYFIIFVYALALLLPTIIAGARDVTVGTDTSGYLSYFEAVKSSNSLVNALTNAYLRRAGIEPGFILLNYLVFKLNLDFPVLLGLMSFLTQLFILLGARLNREKCPIWLVMFCFYMLFYCNFLNIARQGIALSILFLGTYYLDHSKYRTYIFYIVIAGLIHNSAFIGGILLLIIHIYIDKHRSYWKSLIVVVLSTSVLYFFSDLVKFIGRFIPGYIAYLGYFNNQNIIFSPVELLYHVPFLIFATLYYKSLLKYDSCFFTNYLYLWIDLILSQLGAVVGPLSRISLYFAFYKLIITPEFYMIYRTNGPDKISTKIVLYTIFVSLMVFFVWRVIMNGYGFGMPIYPYTSKILGIG